MAVIFSDDVKSKIDEYADALMNYNISEERIDEKVDALCDALMNLDKTSIHTKLCVHKDLGQIFDDNGKPLIQNLYRFNYSDESQTQWAFSYSVNRATNTIIVNKMMLAEMVKESLKHKSMKYILSYSDYCKTTLFL